MESSVSNLCQPKFRILDDAQIARIHQAVLKILNEVGVRVNHPEPLAAEIKKELDRIREGASVVSRK